jgi:hypothetical protein
MHRLVIFPTAGGSDMATRGKANTTCFWLVAGIIGAILWVGCPDKKVIVYLKGTNCPLGDIRINSLSVQNDETSGTRYLKWSLQLLCHTKDGDMPISGASLTISAGGFKKTFGPTDANGNISGDSLGSGVNVGDLGKTGKDKAQISVVGTDGSSHDVQEVVIRYIT